jgi:hypothetical protein
MFDAPAASPTPPMTMPMPAANRQASLTRHADDPRRLPQ